MVSDETFSRNEITLANWREYPFSRWAFQNLPELIPTAEITTASEAEGPVAEPGLIGSLSIHRRGGETVTTLEHFRRSHADRFVMMRDGIVLDEWLAPYAEAERPHVVFSVSKSITGMLAGIAVGDGALDPDGKVSDYVPSKRGSAYDEASVRDLLDMTASLDFEENYLDTTGNFARYRRAMLWNPERPDSEHETIRDVLGSLKPKSRPHGRISCWYDVGDERGSFCAIGLHGQWIWVDPTSRIVLAKMSSRPVPSDDAATAAEIEFLGQVARGL